tara:strand:+ start:274 stop:960 length:687 start_codon:yes stop_codon:yes gene_type:complete
MVVFILAGGVGSRLQSVVKDVPKPMADINGTPFLDYLIAHIRQYFDCKIYLLTHYLSDLIEEYYQDDRMIQIIREPRKLGTGGAIKHAIQHLNLDSHEPILIFNGDTFTNLPLDQFVSYSNESQLVIASTSVENSGRYGTIETSETNQIIGFKEKTNQNIPGYINTGAYYLPRSKFVLTIPGSEFSFEDQLVEWVSQNKQIVSFFYDGSFIDIGVPDDYFRMIEFIKL